MKRWLFLLLLLLPLGSHADITARRQDRQVIISADGAEVLRYQCEPGDLPRAEIPEIYRRGGYLHPLSTPAGRVVTDDYPSNHLHHHGFWSAWTRTRHQGREPDFWNMGQGTGRVEFVRLLHLINDGESAGFAAEHQFIDLTGGAPRPVLTERWEVRVSRLSDGPYAIDVVSRQSCAGPDPLELPRYHYGGFGFRGNWAWNGAGSCHFLTSEGISDRVAGNETRARWCWVGGRLEGDWCGITLMGHPQNFRAPQPVRLHPSEPFFCFAPQQLGAMALRPGEEPYVSRFRLVVADGRPDAGQIEQWWRQWTGSP